MWGGGRQRNKHSNRPAINKNTRTKQSQQLQAYEATYSDSSLKVAKPLGNLGSIFIREKLGFDH